MPEGKELPQPRNLLEAINQNIYLMNENIHTLMKQIASNQQELAALRAMFNVPEKPNVASGDEGTLKESIGSTTNKPSV